MCLFTRLLRFLRSFTSSITRERKEALGKHLIHTMYEYDESFKVANNKLDLPVLDPIQLDDIAVDDFYQLKITNVKLSGTENFTITCIDVDLDYNQIDCSIYLPEVKLYGIQTISLQTDSLPYYVHGSGSIKATISDFKVMLKMKGKRLTHDGKTFLKFNDIQVQINAGAKELIVGSLGGLPTVISPGENYMQHNAEMFVGDMLPALEISLQKAILENINKITSRYTFDEIFPS